jgi:flagellar M-ring protein FliF
MAVTEAGVLGSRLDGGVNVSTSGSLAPVGELPPQQPAGLLAQVLERPAVRKTLPYVGFALVLLLGIIAYTTLSAPPPRALYPEMADADKETAQQLLKKNGIDVKLDSVSGNLQVSANDFHEARILLASAGLPREVGTGFSALKGEMPLGTSQFMERARYNASIEEELAQSIRRINTVRDARVHLALPRESAFIRDRTEPKASVIVTPYNGRSLSDGQVQAIVHLVSSSIPYMTPANVSVVDQFGRLLTESTDGKDLNAKQLELRRKTEADYIDRVVQLLAPIYGAGNVRAQVNADLDFSVIEQTYENFDPSNSGVKVRSEQSNEATTTEPRSQGVPGSLANEPPAGTQAVAAMGAEAAPAGAPGAADAAAGNGTVVRGQQKSQARNYEMDRTVRYVVDPAPRMRRLTVAVAINNAIVAPGSTAKPTPKPLPAAEVGRLTSLVQGAVGFNAQRGDIVNLVSTSFEPPAVETPLPVWERPETLDVAKYLMVALAIALLALLVVRPVVNRLTYVPPPPPPLDQLRDMLAANGIALPDDMGGASMAEGGAATVDGVTVEGGAESMEMREGETLEEFKARVKPKKKPGISAEMLDTANSYDDKVMVVRMLVSQDSKRVALVLKNLINRDLN